MAFGQTALLAVNKQRFRFEKPQSLFIHSTRLCPPWVLESIRALRKIKKAARRELTLLEGSQLKLARAEILSWKMKVDSIHKIPVDASFEVKLKSSFISTERSEPIATRRLKGTLIRCKQRAFEVECNSHFE